MIAAPPRRSNREGCCCRLKWRKPSCLLLDQGRGRRVGTSSGGELRPPGVGGGREGALCRAAGYACPSVRNLQQVWGAAGVACCADRLKGSSCAAPVHVGGSPLGPPQPPQLAPFALLGPENPVLRSSAASPHATRARVPPPGDQPFRRPPTAWSRLQSLLQVPSSSCQAPGRVTSRSLAAPSNLRTGAPAARVRGSACHQEARRPPGARPPN